MANLTTTSSSLPSAGKATVGLIDPQQISFFTYAFTSPGEKLIFATGPEDKGQVRAKAVKGELTYSTKHETVTGAMPWLTERSLQGCALWVCPQELEDKAVRVFRVLYAKMHRQATKVDSSGRLVSEFPIPPSAIVQTSPDHFDYYWACDGEIPEADFYGMTRQLCKSYGAEHHSLDGVRVRRLPGTWNRKAGLLEPFQTKLLSDDGTKYSLDHLKTAFPPLSLQEVDFEPSTPVQSLKEYALKLQNINSKNEEAWLLVGRALWNVSKGSEQAFSIWKHWSPEGKGEVLAKWWADFAVPLDGHNPSGMDIYALAAQELDSQTGELKAVLPRDIFELNDGKVVLNQKNLQAYLDFKRVKLKFNRFTQRAEAHVNGKIENLSDELINSLRMEADERKLRFNKEWFFDAINHFALQNSYHPVKDYLSMLSWDGIERIDTWLIDYCAAEDSALTRAYARKFLIGAVTRIMKPGSKVDTMLVLEGGQGAGKSTVCEIMASKPFFSDSLFIGSSPKDTAEQTAGKWIIEYSELVGIGAKGRERIKRFLSSNTDTYVPKYAKLQMDAPRQFVCIGTTNSKEYLDDPTGNRRFWGVEVGNCYPHFKALREVRDQLWAEAVRYAAAGESPQLPPELWTAQEESANLRVQSDAWYEELQDKIAPELTGYIAAGTVWRLLNIHNIVRDARASKRVEEAMKRLGWDKAPRKRPDGAGRDAAAVACYHKPGSEEWHSFEPRLGELNGELSTPALAPDAKAAMLSRMIEARKLPN